MLAIVIMTASCRTTPPANGSERLPDEVPRNAWRFPIVTTTDSTVRFHATDAQWLRHGMTGYAVDPGSRDAFVARLSLMEVRPGAYTALVTGQLRPVDTSHVVVMVRPAAPWWRTKQFWAGLFTGAVVGTATVIVAR